MTNHSPKQAAAAAPLAIEQRVSAKVIRRDGTVEEHPGEWHDASGETVEQLMANSPSFRAWFKEQWRQAKAEVEKKQAQRDQGKEQA